MMAMGRSELIIKLNQNDSYDRSLLYKHYNTGLENTQV